MMDERETSVKRISLVADPRLYAELERAARLNERSVSAEVRVALRNHLREYGPPALEPGDSPFPEAA